MTNIVEIIPDDLPDWAIEAMAEGQLFITMLDRVKKQEVTLDLYESIQLEDSIRIKKLDQRVGELKKHITWMEDNSNE